MARPFVAAESVLLSRRLLQNMLGLSVTPSNRQLQTNHTHSLLDVDRYSYVEHWIRKYAHKPPKSSKYCAKANADIPEKRDPFCPVPCEGRYKKKPGLLRRIKLKILEGGANFGTPFRRLECKEDESGTCPPKLPKPQPKALPAPKKIPPPMPDKRKGIQIAVLGAETTVGQYVALLLKQCPCIRNLRLYESECPAVQCGNRDMYKAVQDLQHIDTNCIIQAYSIQQDELAKALQCADLVLMLESGRISGTHTFEDRFYYSAPMVKKFADAISYECPKAFIIVCTTPIDCMVPLVGETLRETSWYDPRKVLGSLAVPEMRASTLAARVLNLEPRVTRIPCVGGTEGDTLVPLFSRAIDHFDFTRANAAMMTETVRRASSATASITCTPCPSNASLSIAHAIAGLTKKVAFGLLCQDTPRVTGFVETDYSVVISPARFFTNTVEINARGISNYLGIPHMNDYETTLADKAVDKLLNKLEENEPELASSPEEECVICVNAKATMQTSPCGHRVVCRRCFVKTIQMAVSQRLLPLRCVICRAKILRLRQAPRLVTSKSWQVSSNSGKSWSVPGSVSSYSVGARSVPASASLYSVTSGESSLSGVSSVSSNSGGNVGNACTTKMCAGEKCGGACLGAVPRVPVTTLPRPRMPASHSLRRSQHHSMKARLQEYQVHSYTGGPAGAAVTGEPSGRLPPIREFQRDFREGRRESAAATASASTRIRCAQKIVTQLETSPQKNKQNFFRPLKPQNKDDPPISRDHNKETERKKDNPKTKPNKEDIKPEDKSKKDESSDNRKNEIAEKKKEEKLRLKAEKEAKKEAKQLAKEEERQAKLLAKEEERQAKLLAKEEKKKAKKEAKLAAQAEKEKDKNK